MLLTLTRTHFTDQATLGNLSIDSNPFTCVTVEQVDRGVTQNTPLADIMHYKPLYPHLNAIPYGTYPVAMTWSDRFQRIMPQIMNVPGFDGIRIHIANSSKDVIGCVGVGKQIANDDFITESTSTFNALYPILQDACTREKVFITIQPLTPPGRTA